MSNEHINSVNHNNDLQYRRKKNAEEMKHQVITFALMIFLTLASFVAVAYDGFSPWFTIPFIVLLACVQVIYQLFYFMHMNHKGHEIPIIYMLSGIVIAFVTVLAFVTIIWW